MENSLGINESLLVGILVLVGLSVILQIASLIKIAQMQNGQKHKMQNNQVSANNGKKHGNQNKNKKQQDNRGNQNNRPVQHATNQNKSQPQVVTEKKFDKIVSNALPLKETNAQLANRPKNQQNNKTKVYSERPTEAQSYKQERPANAPIKQQELPKAEIEQEKPQQNQSSDTANPPKRKTDAIPEIKEDAGSVHYGRR
jgi:hypothetical protein